MADLPSKKKPFFRAKPGENGLLEKALSVFLRRHDPDQVLRVCSQPRAKR
jgi:hypothetical protein